MVLKKSQMKPSDKVGVGVFLCLSVVMAVIAIIRISAYRLRGRSGSLDITWVFLWLYLQACIAIIMACLPAFRFLFTRRRSRSRDEEKRKGSPYLPVRSLLRKPVRKGSVGWWSGWEEVGQSNLPRMHFATDHDTGRITTVIYHHKDTSQTEMTRPLRSKISPTWDGVTDQLNDDGVQPGSGKKIDKIYVDHSLESRSDRCSQSGDSQQQE